MEKYGERREREGRGWGLRGGRGGGGLFGGIRGRRRRILMF